LGRALERRNCQGRDLAQPGGTAKDRGKGKDKATADFSTAAAKCAAFFEMTSIGGGTLFNEEAVRN
jgi:hypothetical protein